MIKDIELVIKIFSHRKTSSLDGFTDESTKTMWKKR